MSYKIGYEPWGPSPLDNIVPPESMDMNTSECGAWFAVSILLAVVLILVGLAIATVVL